MKQRMIAALLVMLTMSAAAQEIVYTGTGDARITVSTGDLEADGPVEAPGDGEFVLDLTIRSEFGFPSTSPGLLILDFSNVAAEEKWIGSYRTIETVEIQLDVPFVGEVDFSAKLGTAAPEQAAQVAGRPAALGDLFVQLENETGERALFPMGPLAAWGGSRGMISRNAFHPGDLRAMEALGEFPEQRWYMSALIMTGVRPALMPEEIYLLAVGVTGR